MAWIVWKPKAGVGLLGSVTTLLCKGSFCFKRGGWMSLPPTHFLLQQLEKQQLMVEI